MNNMDDSLDKSIRYIKEWLRINAENQKAVKTLSDILEILQWAKETIDTFPAEGAGFLHAGTVSDLFNATYDSLVQFLPPATPVNLVGLDRVTSTATSVTSIGLFDVLNSAAGDTNERWLAERLDSFSEIQQRHHAIEALRSILATLEAANPCPPNLLEEYYLMIEKALYYRGSEIDKAISAGIAMRNLLEHFKGKLFAVACKFQRENMTWSLMVERLGSPSLLSVGHDLLLKEEQTCNQLHDRLTGLAKNTVVQDVRTLGVQLVVHLTTVLKLVDLDRCPLLGKS